MADQEKRLKMLDSVRRMNEVNILRDLEWQNSSCDINQIEITAMWVAQDESESLTWKSFKL